MAIATINPTTGATEAELSPHHAAETDRRIARAHAGTVALRLMSPLKLTPISKMEGSR